MNIDLSRARDAFEVLNKKAGGIVTPGLTIKTPGNPQDIVTADKMKNGFYRVRLTPENAPKLVGRVLLWHDLNTKVFKEATVMPLRSSPNTFATLLLTVANTVYNPSKGVGLSRGANFALTVKTATESTVFGGHGAGSAFKEQGHFAVVMAAATNQSLQSAITDRTSGHRAVDKALAGGVLGIPERFTNSEYVPPLTFSKIIRPPYDLYWHDALQRQGDIAGLDYGDPTKTLLGAAALKLGDNGIITVTDTVKRMTE